MTLKRHQANLAYDFRCKSVSRCSITTRNPESFMSGHSFGTIIVTLFLRQIFVVEAFFRDSLSSGFGTKWQHLELLSMHEVGFILFCTIHQEFQKGKQGI